MTDQTEAMAIEQKQPRAGNAAEKTAERILILEPGRAERNYWSDLWHYRELFAILAWRDVSVRYKQTVIGLAWALIRPFLTMVVFTIVFGRLAKLPSDGAAPYPIMVFAGMLPWFLFSSILSEASSSLVGNANLISKVYFPRLVIPTASAMVALIDFLVNLAMLAALMLWYGFAPGWRVVLLPAFMLLAVLASLGPALWITALNVKYRDFRYIIPFIVQFGLYVSPVGFSSSVIPADWRFWYSLNPVVGVIDGFRWCLLGGDSPFYLQGFLTSLAVVAFFLWSVCAISVRPSAPLRTWSDFMNDVVIRAEGLGKKYLIGHQVQAERYTALRDVAARTVKGLARSAHDMLQGRQLIAGDEVEEFWALRDVDFEIKRGDVVGVIGRNGAGKSTLLKILSRITEPSTGRVEIKGRVASLLEVGTGFHPELSGRENIYLNGAILGMSRSEIKNKFDEIVAFAEVEQFLDTPVKHYSSGMYVRLAFAVAAHLEPEILVVDEVLAVGDAEFQKKCLGKMGEVASEGRTILFVSHNMGAIERLTRMGIFLSAGKTAFVGKVEHAIARYQASSSTAIGQWRDVSKLKRMYGNGAVRINTLQASYVRSAECASARLVITAQVVVNTPVEAIRLSFTVFSSAGVAIGTGFSSEIDINTFSGQTMTLLATVNDVNLAFGTYILSVAVGNGNAQTGPFEYDVVTEAVDFDISIAGPKEDALVNWQQGWGNVIFPDVSLTSSG